MDDTVVLILLVLVMFIGSYVAGTIPLNVNMSEDKLLKVTVFGAGLLVGTALAVIIPEGVRSLFAEQASTVKDITPEPAVHTDLHSVIGVSLVLGFIFMLLVDQLSARYNDSNHPMDKNFTATVGLVVHAAADGVALGAAARTAHAEVELIVFVAIMLHKAPAAFGLATFLLHAGLDRARVRRQVAVFSVAAPLLALATFCGIGADGPQALHYHNATGVAMLFSAGTFLYVATVHVLPEVSRPRCPPPGALPGPAGGLPGAPGPLPARHVLLLAAGALLPVLLALTHHH